MPRPFDPGPLTPYAAPDLRAPMGVGAMVWRYTVLVPFEEVRPGDSAKILATEDDIEAISESLCNHFGGVSILPPLKGWGLRDPSDPGSIEFNTHIPHVVYVRAIKASDAYFIKLQQELQACLEQGIVLVERQDVFLVG